MQDQHLLQNRIDGLEASLTELRTKKDLFTKAKGLNEEAEKLRFDRDKIRDDISKEKETLKGLIDKKNKAMQTITSAITDKMNAVLPFGSAVIEIKDDGSFFLGWNSGNAIVSYSGLSGGEKAAFDPALCKALGGDILIVEAAEVDSPHLTEALRKYESSGIQTLVSTCHLPEVIPLAWKRVNL